MHKNVGDTGRLRALPLEQPDAVHIGSDPEEWRTDKEILDAAAAGGADIQVVPMASTFTSNVIAPGWKAGGVHQQRL